MNSELQQLLDVVLLKDYNTRLVVPATMLLGVSSGLVGSFLLLRKRSLMGDVLSHATLPGIAIAFAVASLHFDSGKELLPLLVGATLSGLAGVGVMLAIRHTTRLNDDVAMGFVLSVFFGTGIAILRMVQTLPDASGLESFIYGKVASMVASDFRIIAFVAAFTILSTLLLFKEFTLLCFDETFARAEGWPVLLLDVLLLALVTAVTVIGLQAVGLILVIAFLIIPAAAARFWTHRLSVMLLLSAFIGGLSGWLGASLSALFSNFPAGAIIVLSGAALFLVSMLVGRERGVIPRWIDHRRLQRRIGRQHLLRAAYEILETRAGGGPVANREIPTARLLEHRAWAPAVLRRHLREARNEDHIERANETFLLSENGFGEAARITRNHRLWELYLIRHADIAPSHVDRDADLVEHVLGPEIVRELEAELEASQPFPTSPHQIPA